MYFNMIKFICKFQEFDASNDLVSIFKIQIQTLFFPISISCFSFFILFFIFYFKYAEIICEAHNVTIFLKIQGIFCNQ